MRYVYIKSDTSEQYSLLVFIIHRFPPSAAPTHYTDRPMRIYVTATTPLLQRRTNATNALRERRTAAESLVWSADPRPMHGTKLICLCMAAAASSKRRRTICIYEVVYTLIRPLTGGVVLFGVVLLLLRLQRVALG